MRYAYPEWLSPKYSNGSISKTDRNSDYFIICLTGNCLETMLLPNRVPNKNCPVEVTSQAVPFQCGKINPSILLWSGVGSFENLNQFIFELIKQFGIDFPQIHQLNGCFFMIDISCLHWRSFCC